MTGDAVSRIEGPILILGAGGFVGANLFRRLLEHREDVHGTASRLPAWRLEGLPADRIHAGDLLARGRLPDLLDEVRPRLVVNLLAHGAYSFQRDVERIYRTNLDLLVALGEELTRRGSCTLIHAGSSSEYGANAAAPTEDSALAPNSHYAAAKAAASGVIGHLGRDRGLRCASLRLYSVYGPWEDASRLIPSVVAAGEEGRLPEFVDPAVSRDFVHVDDVVDSILAAAADLRTEDHGASFNVGTGVSTTIGDVASLARRVYEIDEEPRFTMPRRDWDLDDWEADPSRAEQRFGWRASIDLEEGLRRTREWYRSLPDREAYRRASAAEPRERRTTISAVVACYRDAEAVPVMHERLAKTFDALAPLGIDGEFVFVNDGSPDDTEEVVRRLSETDPRVVGVTHARNFGSQAAFASGLEIATGDACVLMDGDLQDPPELIADFVRAWREGAEVVYGRRAQREGSRFAAWTARAFYRAFSRLTPFAVPRDAGDFSLLDRRVVRHLLACPERDLFLRGLRAYVGFRQEGVDYVRPERAFGRSTNDLLKNLGWAKLAIVSFSRAPVAWITAAGTLALGSALIAVLLRLVGEIAGWRWSESALSGPVLLVLTLGAVNLLAVGVVGEYVARILTETKGRPRFIRRSLVRNGIVRDVDGEDAR